MLHLAYIIDGLIKKCPLRYRDTKVLGRSTACDIIVNEDFISRRHLRINIHKNSIEITDLKSTNGIYRGGEKIETGKIKIGESFFITDIEFILQEEKIEDFNISKELSNAIKINKDVKIDESDTIRFLSLPHLLLRKILDIGLKSNSIHSFLIESNVLISSLVDEGALLIFSKEKNDIEMLFRQFFDGKIKEINYNLLPDIESLFSKEYKKHQYDDRSFLYSSFVNAKTDMAFVFLTNRKLGERYFDFFKMYLEVTKILMNIFPGYKEKIKNNDEGDINDGAIVTVNKEMKRLMGQTKKLSKTDVFVLIEGESGVGKELFAKLIHENSPRKKKKFVALNCAAIPDSLLEVELFGNEKGAFTGASEKKIGKLELSSEGTLVLDEIGDMPLALQSKLLRVVQEGSFYRVGGTELINADLRIISSTNKNLEEMVADKTFREDLYFRLVHVTMIIPPLRERKNDINSLIKFFTKRVLEKENKIIAGYSVRAINALNEYHWPGNVRELENEIRKLVSLVDNNGLIDFDLLAPKIQMFSQEMAPTVKFNNGIKEKVGNYEKENIIKTLHENQWNKMKTSKELGISYNTLFKKIKKYGIRSNNAING